MRACTPSNDKFKPSFCFVCLSSKNSSVNQSALKMSKPKKSSTLREARDLSFKKMNQKIPELRDHLQTVSKKCSSCSCIYECDDVMLF